jgi:hypothetical protein
MDGGWYWTTESVNANQMYVHKNTLVKTLSEVRVAMLVLGDKLYI